MEEIRTRMTAIEDRRHPRYVKYSLADILIIVMCAVWIYWEICKREFLAKKFGIGEIPSKATFARVLSAVSGKEIGDAILDILRMRFGAAGEVIAVDGKAIRSTAKPDNPHSALQILSAYVAENGIVLTLEHWKIESMYWLGAVHIRGIVICEHILLHKPREGWGKFPGFRNGMGKKRTSYKLSTGRCRRCSYGCAAARLTVFQQKIFVL